MTKDTWATIATTIGVAIVNLIAGFFLVRWQIISTRGVQPNPARQQSSPDSSQLLDKPKRIITVFLLFSVAFWTVILLREAIQSAPVTRLTVFVMASSVGFIVADCLGLFTLVLFTSQNVVNHSLLDGLMAIAAALKGTNSNE
jgi:hypothetical protein